MKKAPEKPIYRQIHDYVFGNIVAGTYRKDGRLPTDGQLMRRFKVSRATVAKAMKELEQAGLIQRRPGAGSFLRPNDTANGSFVSTLIAGLGDTQFFEPICAQIARSCNACNLHLIWGASSPTVPINAATDIRDTCDRLIQQRVKGVFFVPDELAVNAPTNRNLEIARSLEEAGIKVVLIDRDVVPYPEQGVYDLVGIDNVNAGFKQTRHLMDCGCRRILYLARPDALCTKDARIEGYRLALASAGFKPDAALIRLGDPRDIKFCEELLQLKPDGVACFNDPMAIHLIHNSIRLGAAIPRDLKVVGLDDVHYSDLLPIPLTTLSQPCDSIGAQAAEVMVRRLNHDTHPPRRILFSTRLIVRRSTQITL